MHTNKKNVDIKFSAHNVFLEYFSSGMLKGKHFWGKENQSSSAELPKSAKVGNGCERQYYCNNNYMI